MSREAMSEEERRRRRNEASRRCYLKRKAETAVQAQPVGVKNKKAKPTETKPVKAKPARRGPDSLVAAERLCKTYAKVANGVKPMIKDAAEFLGIIYKSEDQRVAEKVERILEKGLGVKVLSPAADNQAKSRVILEVLSKAVKTPKFRLTSDEQPEPERPQPEPAEPEDEPAESEDEIEDAPAEVPVDPNLLDKVESGEVDKSEIDLPSGTAESDDETDDEDEDGDETEDGDEDEDEDDEDDESEEAQERRARRRRREESNNVRDYEAGRWEMLGEMGAQGAFDD